MDEITTQYRNARELVEQAGTGIAPRIDDNFDRSCGVRVDSLNVVVDLSHNTDEPADPALTAGCRNSPQVIWKPESP